ncbi:phage major capsid protein [Thermomicrobiaceae bacterium CFH 74404]|uniref:Phage major capsid protein n=1 Tax=Thermalbibacter longus TaxID=2951981 RepID=A0AA41WHD6_9BACT|nr:phage major capsid protein [Thermalbibacter longus]MCM8750669.1 phage major capsid protein [Thermalbibacter longus]
MKKKFHLMDVNELRQEREHALERMDVLIERAGKERRFFSPHEAAEFDQLEATVNEIDQELASREAKRTVDPALLPQVGDHQRGTSMGGPLERSNGLLAPEQRLADITPPPAGASTVGLGQFLRGVFTGAWDAETRALGIGTPSAGGYLVPEPLAVQIIDLARAQARVIQAGARTVRMDSATLTLPKLTRDPVPSWIAEHATVTESDPEFGSVQLEAKTLAVLVKVSRQLIEDARPEVEPILRNAFAQSLSLGLDKAALYGAGTATEPRGIVNTSGIVVYDMGTDGAALTDYKPLLQAYQLVLANNHTPTAAILAPRTLVEIESLTDSTGQPLQPPAILRDLRMLPTTQVPTDLTHGTATNASDVFMADFANLVIGVRTQMQVLPLQELFAANLQVGFVAYLRADIALIRPGAFAVIRGIIPPA